MRLLTKLMIPMLVLAMVGIADGKAIKKPKATVIKGKIESVTNGTITLRSSKKSTAASKKVVSTTKDTLVTVNGTVGRKVSDLLPGQTVVITTAAGTATEITATNPLPKGRHVKVKV